MAKKSKQQQLQGYHVFNVNTYIGSKISPSPPEPNRPIRIGTEVISDEELVLSSNYNFNLDIDILLSNSMTTRKAIYDMKRGIFRPPRPQNAFMLYRRDKSSGPDYFGLKSSETSTIIGIMWKAESKEVKGLFEALARMAEKRHSEKHENYRYEPRKPSGLPKSKKKRMESNDKNSTDAVTNPSLPPIETNNHIDGSVEFNQHLYLQCPQPSLNPCFYDFIPTNMFENKNINDITKEVNVTEVVSNPSQTYNEYTLDYSEYLNLDI
ncbi:11655_t:CDS:1 [Funneliformis geosporum]|uniref:1180_t:CDS:1 n=1 Tax=Funneliformis geosporum TaxID=1117311 RepID=A0A9W4SL59_9GLOM|nr:1180_t:CDS:1 [Funneliformis geosporum]CAI2172936.1 11655_t:CDS:1 [Funneliformis geosporum]